MYKLEVTGIGLKRNYVIEAMGETCYYVTENQAHLLYPEFEQNMLEGNLKGRITNALGELVREFDLKVERRNGTELRFSTNDSPPKVQNVRMIEEHKVQKPIKKTPSTKKGNT